MSKDYRYSNELKQEAVNQVTVYGYAIEIFFNPKRRHT